MPVTLHVDLLRTTLEDFDSHFLVPLNYIDGFLRGQRKVPPIVYYGLRTEEFTEDKYNIVFPNTSLTRARFTDYENAKKMLNERENLNAERARSATAMVGYIQIIRSIRGPRITYEAVLLAVVRHGQVEIVESTQVYFMLYVARYQQNRLKLLLDEAGEGKKPYAELILDWLDTRWGNAVRPLPLENMPSLLPNRNYADLIRETKDTIQTAKELWPAVMSIYAEWRQTRSKDATHKRLAILMNCSVAHIKKMWSLHKPDDDRS